MLFNTIGIAASEFFCQNLSTMASLLGLSESLAGVTFLAFGNGSPDVFSTFAAMRTHSGSLAIGELIGAAGFITAVVAGSMALVRPFKVPRKTFVRDVGFFTVAASFSMVFLADGHLSLWECAVMVGFYVFYVVFVLGWHWYFGQRSHRRLIENTARSHFQGGGPNEEVMEPYHDDEDEGDDTMPADARSPARVVSTDDFAALERGNGPSGGALNGEEVDEETREHYLAEISSNMRLSRPRPGERRSTVNPIRPSLVGALEFNAVLSSLRKSRNIQTIPINLRRYSDDPSFTLAQQQERRQGAPESTQDHLDAHQIATSSEQELERSAASSRIRAVSANDAANLHLDSALLQERQGPEIDLLEPSPPEGSPLGDSHGGPSSGNGNLGDSRTVNGRPDYGYLAQSPGTITPSEGKPTLSMLVPPDEAASQSVISMSRRGTGSSRNSLFPPENMHTPRVLPPYSPRTGASSPLTPFPEYRDDSSFRRHSRAPSIRLPPPSIGSESNVHLRDFETEDEDEEKPIAWWPNRFLPSPRTLLSTLFPTLYSWSNTSIWERFLGIITAPSVFLLTITLPVVERSEDEKVQSVPAPGLLSPKNSFPQQTDTRISILPPDSPSAEPNVDQGGDSRTVLERTASTDHSRKHDNVSSPKDWNRWLVAIQLLLAPLFMTLLLHANGFFGLLRPILISLLISLVLLALLLLTSSPDRPPRYRPAFTFLGFLVSVAWISTIASEVVGVLKSLGVILQISDAILGLTVFAVGNSLGDLVADITVAKLGYPVMALSACFGGPMLNILLGIGVSGLFMTITGGQKWSERHPHRPVKYKPYVISVSPSLVISGVTLLVTLLGLLIIVPMNKWVMDKRIGWGLIALWMASTAGNLIVEVGGWARDIA